MLADVLKSSLGAVVLAGALVVAAASIALVGALELRRDVGVLGLVEGRWTALTDGGWMIEMAAGPGLALLLPVAAVLGLLLGVARGRG